MLGAFVAVGEHYGPNQQTATLAFEDTIERKIALDKQGFAWDQEWPRDYEAWSRDQGRTLFFDWNTNRLDGSDVMWADIAAGRHDAELDARAEALKEFGAPAFLSFHHEPEGEPAGTPEEFVRAYRHIQNRFDAQGVTNLSYVVVLMAYTFRQGDPDPYYPGDRYVDVLAADGYNWYGCPDRGDPWRSFEFIFEDFYQFGLDRGKPMMIAEWASHEDPADPGRKAEWIAEAAEVIRGWPEIKALSWYDNGLPAGNCDWWVDSSESSLNAFVRMGAERYFNPAPPLVTITSGPPDPDPSSSATFVFSSNVPASTFTCSLDLGVDRPCSSGLTLEDLSDAAHTLRVTATDPVTGLTGYTTHAWTVDTAPPTLTLDRTPAEITGETRATFHMIPSEPTPPGYLTCRLDLGGVEECGPWTTYEDLADGVHTFRGTAVDEAGNRSEPQVWVWTVDTLPPVATITDGPEPLSGSRSATFTFSSDDPDATFKCSRDAGAFAECTSPKTYNWLDDGAHSFAVIAVDLAGNRSLSAEWAWVVDSTPPVTTILLGPPDPSPDPTATFLFRADELGATFTCSLDESPERPCLSPVLYRNIPPGEHEFAVFATDLAGNAGNVAVWRWTRVGESPRRLR
jgi:hypothetical protein